MNKKIQKMLLVELGILFLALIIFILIQFDLVKFLPACPIYTYFGILCPSCQGTRCVLNFVTGNFLTSFYYHPIFFITIIYFMIVNLIYIINSFLKKDILTVLYPKTKFWIVFLIILGIFTLVRNIF